MLTASLFYECIKSSAMHKNEASYYLFIFDDIHTKNMFG